MKLNLFIVMLSVVLSVGCQKQNDQDQSEKYLMSLDSTYMNEDNVIIVQKNDTIRLGETMIHFEDNPNIMQTDIDAANKTPNPGVQYVKKGDSLRIMEPKTKK